MSGACSDSGTCVDEGSIVYVDPNGVDSGTCGRMAPCKGFGFALMKTTPARNHLVMGSGTYSRNFLRISPQSTTAASMFVHGRGATLTSDLGDGPPLVDLELPTTMRDVSIVYGPSGPAIAARSPVLLERINMRSEFGLRVLSSLTARDLVVEAVGTTGSGIVVDGTLTLDGAVISGGIHGITASNTSVVEITNAMVFNTSEVGINLSGSTDGSINFTTVADTGLGASSINAAGIYCTNPVSIRSSVVWTPSSSRISVFGCSFANTSIAGPMGASGAMNIDPLFVAPVSRNYRLSTSSPAKDVAPAGPQRDFEGDVRPVNLYDLGADEIQP